MNEKILYLKSWITSTYINFIGDKKYPFKQILVVKLDEIGDMVTAMPVFYNLHIVYPEAKITLVCKRFNFIFFAHIPYIACTSEIPKNGTYFDLIVDLRGNDESIKYALKNKPQYRLDRGKIRIINKFLGGQKHEIDTNLAIISPLIAGKVLTDNYLVASAEEQQKINTFLQLHKIKSFAILHLGARDETRRWPIDRFAECIDYLNNDFEIPCILVGGPDDNLLNEKCLKMVKQQVNFNVVGNFNLLEFYELCRRSSLFIGNESGPLHIASAAKTSIVALFGPGVKNVFYPKGENVKIHHYFLKKNHKNQTIQTSTILKISVDEVQLSIENLLHKKGELL